MTLWWDCWKWRLLQQHVTHILASALCWVTTRRWACVFKLVLGRKTTPWAPAIHAVATVSQRGAGLPCHLCPSKAPGPRHNPFSWPAPCRPQAFESFRCQHQHMWVVVGRRCLRGCSVGQSCFLPSLICSSLNPQPGHGDIPCHGPGWGLEGLLLCASPAGRGVPVSSRRSWGPCPQHYLTFPTSILASPSAFPVPQSQQQPLSLASHTLYRGTAKRYTQSGNTEIAE